MCVHGRYFKVGNKASDGTGNYSYSNASDGITMCRRRSIKDINKKGYLQEDVHNTAPIPQLQVVLSFKVRLAMDMKEEMVGESMPLNDGGRPLCMSYHLKCVCNYNCRGHHMHMHLLVIYHSIFEAWKAQFCVIMPPLMVSVEF